VSSPPITAYRWIGAIALLGVLISALAYHYSQSREEAGLRAHFEHLAHDRVLRLQGALDQTLTVLTSLRGLFDASQEVTRDEFKVMTAPMLERTPDIMALNWAPKVMHSERQRIEQRLRGEGYAAQGLFDVSADALNPHPAAERPLYFPVIYSEPETRNRRAIGLDPYARPENRAAMEAAMRSGKPWSTPPFALVQDPKGYLAVAVYQPVFQPGWPLTTAAMREAALRGFVILVLRPGALIENTLHKLAPIGLDKQLLDGRGHLIHHHFSRLSPPSIRSAEPLRRDDALVIPGGVWSVRVSATEGFHQQAGGNESPVVLATALLLTALVTLFLTLLARQNRRQAELAESLAESEARFRQLAENIEAVFWINTPGWQRVLYISPAYERIWGRSAASLYAQGMDWFDAVLPEDRPALLEKLPNKTSGDWQTIEFPPYRIRRPDGGIRWIAARSYSIHDERGRIVRVAGIAEDISERHAYQAHLEDLAHYDPLTHLPNRRLLADRMQQALVHAHRGGQWLAICVLDLDGFKPVNDRHGHKMGDQLLISVARRLQDSVRGDDTVARLGGDEFVLLLGGLDSLKEVDETLARLLLSIASPHGLVEPPIILSASIGITLYPNDAGDADTLLRHADHAMYLAKEAGKNRYQLFSPALEPREQNNGSAWQTE